MQSTLSLSSLSGPLWFCVVATDRVLSMGQIELLDHLTWQKINNLWTEIELFDH